MRVDRERPLPRSAGVVAIAQPQKDLAELLKGRGGRVVDRERAAAHRDRRRVVPLAAGDDRKRSHGWDRAGGQLERALEGRLGLVGTAVLQESLAQVVLRRRASGGERNEVLVRANRVLLRELPELEAEPDRVLLELDG